jgi:hypothetical protein
MLTLLHYLPHMLFGGLGALALVVLFGDERRTKRVYPERIRQQYYTWNDRSAHRD